MHCNNINIMIQLLKKYGLREMMKSGNKAVPVFITAFRSIRPVEAACVKGWQQHVTNDRSKLIWMNVPTQTADARRPSVLTGFPSELFFGMLQTVSAIAGAVLPLHVLPPHTLLQLCRGSPKAKKEQRCSLPSFTAVIHPTVIEIPPLI